MLESKPNALQQLLYKSFSEIQTTKKSFGSSIFAIAFSIFGICQIVSHKYFMKSGSHDGLAAKGSDFADTVDVHLTATQLIQPPHYYCHFILAWTKAQFIILLFKELLLCPYLPH